MSTKKLLFFYALIVILGVVAVVQFGMGPRTIEKIKFSEFENSQVVVNSLLLSLRQDLRENPILILGIDSQDPFQQEVLMKFLEMNQEPGTKYDGVLLDSSLQVPEGLVAESFSVLREFDRFYAGIQTVLDRKLRLMVLLPNNQSSAILPESISQKLKQKLKKSPATMITFSNFPRSREEEPTLSIPCNTGEADAGQTRKLGCQILQKARSLYRKKMKSGALIGFMNQAGPADYVFALTDEK